MGHVPSRERVQGTSGPGVSGLRLSLALVLPVVLASGCAPSGPEPSIPPWDGPGVSGFVQTPDGERIHYVELEEGSGPGRPTLLFVPGWTMTVEIWESQLRHFAASHRVVAMDPRSQGRSSKARDGHTAGARAGDIRAVVEALDLEPVVLVGWSMAVTEVVAYVERYGTDGVAGLVLVDGVAGQDPDPRMSAMFMDWTAGFVHDRRAATDAFVRGMYRREHPPEYLAAVAEQSLLTPTDAAAALVVATARHDFRSTLPRINRPVLITATAGSPWDPYYAQMAEAIPGARLEWFPDAGHALFVDEAGRFNTLLESFLQGVD
jgi:pimeloyl-ACP methyl ester carboxylesterase